MITNQEFEDYMNQMVSFHKEQCPIICMEECSELIQAISKKIRDGEKIDEKHNGNLCEEIADVFTSALMLVNYYGLSEEEIDKWFEFKQQRNLARIKNNS